MTNPDHMQDSCTRGAILKTSKWIFWNPDMKLEINPMWSGTKSRFSMVHACQTVNSMNSSPPQPSQVHPQCTVPSTNPACSVLTHHMQSGRPASFLWLSITTSASTTNWREQTMFTGSGTTQNRQPQAGEMKARTASGSIPGRANIARYWTQAFFVETTMFRNPKDKRREAQRRGTPRLGQLALSASSCVHTKHASAVCLDSLKPLFTHAHSPTLGHALHKESPTRHSLNTRAEYVYRDYRYIDYRYIDIDIVKMVTCSCRPLQMRRSSAGSCCTRCLSRCYHCLCS